MARWERVRSATGALRLITVLGGLFAAIAVGRVVLVLVDGGPVAQAAVEFVLFGFSGAVLWYGRVWLPRSQVLPEVYPRVGGWCLGGLGVMLAIVGLLVLDPAGTVDDPLRAAAIAAGVGASGGLGIGVNEARAISRAREAERHWDELRLERDLRDRIVETSPIGITVVNTDRTTRMANERAAEIVGLDREDLLALEYDESVLETTDAAGAPLERGVFRHVIETGDPVYDAERQMTRPDERRIWLSVSGAPLHDAFGEIDAVVFAFKDITERKRLERDLQGTVERLERSNDRLREFAYAASHDLQEPLRMVSSYLQLLEQRYPDELDAEAREFIGFAVSGADRMRRMIQALLEYSRLEQRGAAFAPVECEPVIEAVQSDLEVQIEETNAEVVTGALPRVHGDETQLKQLFQNLVSNALKYRRDEPPRVEIRAEPSDDDWVFSVSDNGIGIDPAHAEQIFRVFNRLHSEGDYPGTGIGLSLCQRIVERHGGRIWVESEPGRGSTFYVRLPAEPPLASESAS